MITGSAPVRDIRPRRQGHTPGTRRVGPRQGDAPAARHRARLRKEDVPAKEAPTLELEADPAHTLHRTAALYLRRGARRGQDDCDGDDGQAHTDIELQVGAARSPVGGHSDFRQRPVEVGYQVLWVLEPD